MTPHISRPIFLGTMTRRRIFTVAGATAGASLLVPSPGLTAADTPRGPTRTWLDGVDDLAASMTSPEPSADEIADRTAYPARATPEQWAAVERWSGVNGLLAWTTAALDAIAASEMNPVRASRVIAIVQTAADDALVAAGVARQSAGQSTAFPNQTVIAGAMAAIFPPLFSASVLDAERLAEAAANSPRWAGNAHGSEIAAGLALGRAIGGLAVARASADGSETEWTDTVPGGPGFWRPTPPAYLESPVEPTAGSWLPWVATNVPASRPAPPPAYGTEAQAAELSAVQRAVAHRTDQQAAIALRWAGGPGTVTPAGFWIEIARDLILRDHLDLPIATHVLAQVGVALADAFICCWDTKFTYWGVRPITLDRDLQVLFPTPPFPTYTSGHSTISAAAATVLAHQFPSDAADLRLLADQARDSRLWAGIHFPIDNELGAALGAAVGRRVIEFSRTVATG